MDDKINKIIKELYLLNPDLKNHEEDLNELLHEMLAYKPEIEIDERFVKELRNVLEARACVLMRNKRKKMFDWRAVWNRHKLLITPVPVVALLIVLFLFGLSAEKSNIDLGYWGSLEIVPSEKQFGEFDLEAIKPSEIEGRGAGGGGDQLGQKQTQKEVGVFSEPGNLNIKNFKYVYVGEDFDLMGEKASVLKREKNFKNTKKLADYLQKNLNIGLLELSNFAQLKVKNINLLQEGLGGYAINLDLENSELSLSFVNDGVGVDFVDESGKTVKTDEQSGKDLLNFSQVVEISRSFLTEKGVNLSSYGEAVVQNVLFDGKNLQENLPIINIVFPLEIEGKNVYDQGGQLIGIKLVYDRKTNIIIRVWGIKSLRYSAVEYDLINSVEEVLSKSNIQKQKKVREKEDGELVKLTTPNLCYVETFKYTQEGVQEFLVPALIFVEKKEPKEEKNDGLDKKVIVPLVENLN